MKRGGLNSGCVERCGECAECVSALPFGASCAGSCQRVQQCKAEHGIKGNEGACRFVPSRFEPHGELTRSTLTMLEEDDSLYGVGVPV